MLQNERQAQLSKTNSETSSDTANWICRADIALAEGVQLPDGNYPELIRRFFQARRLTDSLEIEAIVQPQLANLQEPLAILDMQVAVDRLIKALKANEKICIYADFDLDGTSGLALLSEGLRGLGFAALVLYQPKRLADGYGFHVSAVEDLAQQGVSLILTVDVGITANKAVERAQQLGIEVIITDHHQPGASLPKALAVVNPNRPDDQSGLGYLCGAGVAFYLLRALVKRIAQENLPTPLQGQKPINLKGLLDFFTIATLTDMVPLVADNRVLVKHGLQLLSDSQRPGLRVLLDKLGLAERNLNAQDIAIRFAPKLNALSRMEKAVLPIDILLESDWQLAQEKIAFVLENNQDRMNLQSDGEKQAEAALQDWPHQSFFYFSSQAIHRGIAGLIATKMAQRTGSPAYIGSESADGIVVGSARVPPQSQHSVLQGLHSAANCLHRFGGHHAAAGFEHPVSATAELMASLAQFHQPKRNQGPEKFQIEYDLDLEIQQITDGLLRWLDALGPFGQGFPVPLFCLRQVAVTHITKLRGDHLKLTVGQAEQQLTALFFSPPSEAFQLQKGDVVDLLFELQWNFYQGKKSKQLLIKEIRL